MATPEELADQADFAADEETSTKSGKKGGGAKHFDQPGVRFSIEELRALELRRKEETDESFRQHVESALIYYYQNPQNDWDKENAPDDATLAQWAKDVATNARAGGGAMAAAKAREAAHLDEIAALKAQIAQMKGNKVSS